MSVDAANAAPNRADSAESAEDLVINQELRLAYRPTTGELWRTDSAGTPTRELATWYWSERHGRPLPTSICLPDGTRRVATHIIIYVMTGKWPRAGMYIDHIDRQPMNNRFDNLREATPSQNMQNVDRQSRRLNGRDQVLEQGVTMARPGRYVVTLAGMNYGSYQSSVEANQVAREQRRRLYGEFALPPITWRRHHGPTSQILRGHRERTATMADQTLFDEAFDAALAAMVRSGR